jgi:serine/threonine-protein kinase
LKFLPRALQQDASRLERFYSEVRIARQVSHPNVCRVYDVGEIEGQPFLSMEFVDGEDLASLLRRIGRLPADKSLDIARELCAGLGAAHDRGVLHRDLKPANVMIDGRGRARITDFGLAVAAGDSTEGEVSGTPAYMAPEQLAGRGATIQSDIHALGLVLYELSTGHKAFDAATLPELRRKHTEEAPAPPSSISPGFDPAVERVILRCLEKDPSRRPASVALVAAALPGGDPLAAAIAAGETPSPEMVAAAGEEGALSRPRAWLLLGGALATVLVLLLLAPYSTDLGVAPLPKGYGTLVDRAQELVQRFGYGEPPADTDAWWRRQEDYLNYRSVHLRSPERVRELASVEPHPWWLWYRQSGRRMIPVNGDGFVRDDDPPLEISGMIRLALDARGNLVRFRAVPPQIDESKGPWPDPGWEALFREAGLDSKRFTPSGPKWVPPIAFDARAEWDGSFASQPALQIHVTAAAYHGKPVFFEVLGPWDRPVLMEGESHTFTWIASRAGVVVVIIALLLTGSLVARRNLRLGRGDRRGAFRVSGFLLVLVMLAWLLSSHHVPDVRGEWGMFLARCGEALFNAAFVWVLYVALEPVVRRRWPDLLISWTRLLAGGFRDPLVGHDSLVGILIGGAAAIVLHVANALPAWANIPQMTPVPPANRPLGAPQALFGGIFFFAALSVVEALAIMALLILSRVVFRRRWLALGASLLVLTVLGLTGENIAVEAPMSLVLAVLIVFVATRFGLLALAFRQLTYHLLTVFPLTLDFSRWYAGRSLFVVLVVVGLALFSFRTSLGGKPVFGGVALEEA